MRLSRLLPVLPLLLASAPARALPDAPAPASTDAAASSALFVELVVNAQANGALAAVTQEGGRLWVGASALRDAGIAVSGGGRIDVTAQPDFHATYDAPGQRLLLDVPPALLPTRRIAGDPREAARTIVDTGALLNYDLYVQHGDGHTTAALWTEQRAFGGFGALSNTGVLRVGTPGREGYVRLDTRYRFVDERRVLTVTAGDLITQALPWTTAVRVGGVQVARSFRVRPDLVTVPLPSFAGQAAVPSGVDLFVNGYRQQRAEVAPGRFVLDDVPVVNGAGEARIVTTDAVGRQVATVVPFYVAAELLRPGLTDFAVEAGALRRGYGITSLDYGRAVASASVRRGVSERLTVEGHAEAAAGLAAGGGGVVWAPGLWGALHGTLAASRRGRATGVQATAGYTYTGRRFGLGIEHVQRSAGFADLGSFDLRAWRGRMRADRASASITLPAIGNVGLGYIDSRTRDGSRVRLASASLSMPIGGRASLFGAADYDIDRRGASAQLRLSVPFGRSGIAGTGLSRQPGGDLRAQASIARSVPTEGGLGLSADTAVDRRGDTYGQATATWRGPRQQVDAGTAWAAGNRLSWGGVTGAVAWLDRRLVAANALPDAFAVVATGAARVPVYYENQLIGVTGRDGRLFVPRVTAWHPGHFAIDAIGLPIGMQARTIETRVALREGAGAVIRMPVTVTGSATIRLVDGAGAALPPGTAVLLPGGGATVVGWDGVVLLEGLSGPVDLAAAAPAGRCHARVTMPRDDALLADLGVVRCG